MKVRVATGSPTQGPMGTPSAKGGFRRALKFTGLAVKLMWEADRKTVALTGLLQIVSGAGIALLLLLGKKALTVILAARNPVEGLDEAAPWFGGVLLIYALLNFASSAHLGMHRLLAERTIRYFQNRI